jgi:hypothetical protein
MKKVNLLKEYWPQITAFTMLVFILGGNFYAFQNIQDKIEEQQKRQAQANEKFAQTLKQVTEYLNGEDDGVRGDFGVGDQNIKEYEDLRSQKDILEVKVWHYENLNK